MQDKLLQAYELIKERLPYKPKLGIVLGSGLGDFADKVKVDCVIDYKDIAGMPQSTVEGHKGRFVFANIEGVPCVLMQGRVHYYEGYTTQEVVLPIRLMKLFGAEALFVTNAAGGITYPTVGQLMLITDQISLVPSPLIGKNIDMLGVRFPDMTTPYDDDFCRIARDSAKTLGIDLKEGTYIQFSGPSFETKADIKMARILGADAVGMSTAIEVIAARHANMRVVGISCITNPACGVTSQKLSHVDVQVAADKSGEKLRQLIIMIISKMNL